MLATRRSTSILKHPDAIHVAAKKNGKFNLLHRKMLNSLSFLAKEDVEQFTDFRSIDEFLDHYEGKEVDHQANVTDFKTILKYNSNDTTYLRTVLTELMGTVLEFDVLKPEDKRAFKAMPLLTNAEIEGGVVRWSYRSELRRMLLSPDRFQRLDLEITNSFGQDSALALYENVIRFEGISFTPWFSIDDFRILLGATSKSYSQYKVFNVRVLKPGLKQVEEISGVRFKPITKKRGKSIAFIKFEIIRAQSQDMFQESDEANRPDDEIRKSLRAMGIADSQIKEIYEAYDLAYLEEKILWLNEQLCTNSAIKNPAAFAYAAIRDDYSTSSVDTKRPVEDVMKADEATLKAVNGVGCPMYPEKILKAYLDSELMAESMMIYRRMLQTSQTKSTLKPKELKEAIEGDLAQESNPLHDSFMTFLKGRVFMNNGMSLQVRDAIKASAQEIAQGV